MTQYYPRITDWLKLGDLRSPPGQNPLLKQDPLGMIAHVQVAFGALQGWRLHDLLRSLCLCSVMLRVKKCFLMFNGNILCIGNLCPLPVVLSLGSTEKNLALSSLHALIRLSMYNTKFPFESSLLRSKPFQLSHSFLIRRMIQPFHHFCCLLLDSFQSVHVSLVLGSQELNTELQALNTEHQCSVEGKDHHSQPADNPFCNAAQNIFHLFCGKGTLLDDVKPAVTRTPSIFSVKLIPSCVTSRIYGAWNCFLSAAGLHTSG